MVWNARGSCARRPPGLQALGRETGSSEKISQGGNCSLLQTSYKFRVQLNHLLAPGHHRLHQSGRQKQFSSNNGYQGQCVTGISTRSQPAPPRSRRRQDFEGYRASPKAPGAPVALRYVKTVSNIPAWLPPCRAPGETTAPDSPRAGRAPPPLARPRPARPGPPPSGLRTGRGGGREEGAPAAGGILRSA